LALGAAAILLLRSGSTSSCIEAQQPFQLEVPGPPPPQAANLSPEVIQDWIAHKDEIHQAEGIGQEGGIAGSSPFEGPPPTGFASWDDFVQWAAPHFDPYAPAEVQFEFEPGGVGGVAKPPEVELPNPSSC
jgi:hypothetical protein